MFKKDKIMTEKECLLAAFPSRGVLRYASSTAVLITAASIDPIRG